MLLAYATAPALATVQTISAHFLPSQVQRLGGVVTNATVPADAALHGGSAAWFGITTATV